MLPIPRKRELGNQLFSVTIKFCSIDMFGQLKYSYRNPISIVLFNIDLNIVTCLSITVSGEYIINLLY